METTVRSEKLGNVLKNQSRSLVPPGNTGFS